MDVKISFTFDDRLPVPQRIIITPGIGIELHYQGGITQYPLAEQVTFHFPKKKELKRPL